MTLLRIRKSWQLPESSVTPESVFWNRRRFLKAMGAATIGSAGLLYGKSLTAGSPMMDEIAALPRIEVERNAKYSTISQFTKESIAAKYNNFYEFSRDKDDVWEHAKAFKPRPWQIEVSGLVEKPRIYDIDDLIKRMPLEERVYRFRCVEAWAMVIPWIGFPVKALLDDVQPLSNAKFVKMTTFYDPEVAPRQNDGLFSSEPWPYTEGLTIAEAVHELSMFAVGIYGHDLPKQHGAPIRLVVPWKYGFKNIKSIVKIELVENQPPTFWNTIAPNEYGFESNVNPKVPHPRWSQAIERVLGTGSRQRTLLFNGYADLVGHLYQTG